MEYTTIISCFNLSGIREIMDEYDGISFICAGDGKMESCLVTYLDLNPKCVLLTDLNYFVSVKDAVVHSQEQVEATSQFFKFAGSVFHFKTLRDLRLYCDGKKFLHVAIRPNIQESAGTLTYAEMLHESNLLGQCIIFKEVKNGWAVGTYPGFVGSF